MRLALIAAVAAGLFTPSFALAADGTLTVYVGTYTGPKSKGIYRFDLDLATGKLTPAGEPTEAPNPSFLAIHPSGKYLYAASEVGGGGKPGAVLAFAIQPDGSLKALNSESSGGSGPCHLVVDKAGKNVLVANYGGGSVACLPIQDDGSLKAPSATIQHQGSGPDPSRQKGPHAHSINLDPANKFAFAADLGLDKVLIYKFDPAAGSLVANGDKVGSVPAGSGPRHFAFHPTGKFAYVINEMTSTVTAYAYDAEQGALKEMQTLPTLPEPVKGNSTAEVVVHPSGKFLYGSNRGHDSIAVFTIDQESGRLTAAGHTPIGGKTPRNFAIDPTGAYLLAAGQNSHTISVFKIDPQSGALTAVGEPVSAPSPVCIRFLKK